MIHIQKTHKTLALGIATQMLFMLLFLHVFLVFDFTS